MTLEWSTRFQKVKDKTCLIQGLEGNSFSYQQLIEYIRFWKNLLTENGVTGQSVVAFPGRYNASNVSLLLAVSEIGGVAVPLPGDGEDRIEQIGRAHV